MDMDTVQNIRLFSELVGCGSDVYTWCYDAQGALLSSNCPEETLLAEAFSLFGCREQMLAHGREADEPLILGTAFGLLWGAAFEKEGGHLQRAYVIGPVFFTDVSKQGIETGFAHYKGREGSLAWKSRFLDAAEGIPTAQNIVFSRYVLMLHYCITGEKRNVSDIAFHASQGKQPQGSIVPRDRHKVWTAERAMLERVRTGDLNYKSELSRSMLSSSGVPVRGADPLGQAKVSVIVFTSLVCRAAIEGGLSPEEAYSLGDFYIQSAERAAEYSDIAAIAPTMYDDFVRRVHKRRSAPHYSKPVQRCCDYVQMHLDERILARDVAKAVGYTEYYLTRRFCAETGMCLNDYINAQKVAHAKFLLAESDLSVQDISERLGYSSRAYFTQVFGRIEGCSPKAYRSKRGG